MQIYTKILIGMAIGAVIGLVAGPKSPFLEKDLYTVNSGSVKLYTSLTDAGDLENPLPLPDDLALRLPLIETKVASFSTPDGESAEGPVAAKVRLHIDNRMVLRDSDNRLSEALGGIRSGQKVDAWLAIDHAPLEGGGFAFFPQPISGLGDSVVAFLRPVGTAFMRLIKMVIVPLVFASLLVGVASLGDIRKLGRLGGKTLGLYMATTAVAVTIGLVVAHVMNPGSFVDQGSRAALQAEFEGAASSRAQAAADAPSTIDNILRIIPENPIGSLASGDMLQIIFFAVFFGIALTLLDDKNGRPVVTFFDRVQHAMIIVIHIVMMLAPYGVAALLADVVGTSGISLLGALLAYAMAVLIGLFLHASLTYGVLVRLVARVPLGGFLRAARPAQLIAFSTSSSSAALPVTMECAEENMGISNSTSSFVLPLGSTVNMDGTALYQGVAAVFIAQVFQIDLSIGQQLGIVFTATMASVGAAGVPGAGMVTLAMVLTSAGIPAVGVALILGMDRLLDMFRTMINVTGDLAVTATMAASEGERLSLLDPVADEADTTRGFEGRLDREPQPVEPD